MSAIQGQDTAGSSTGPSTSHKTSNMTSGQAQVAQMDTKDSTKTKLLGLLGKGKKQGTQEEQISEGQESQTSITDGPQPKTMASPRSPPSAHALHSLGDLHPRSSSPQLQSPASSLIFERNVQEASLSPDTASAIPSHLKTDDQIPPALEASSLVITDSHLAPDEVEIVTHTAHQPAAAIIAETIPSAHTSEAHLPSTTHHESLHEPAAAHAHDGDDNASTYGSLDPNDVRRLSFISFADVVHAEHVETGAAHHPAPPNTHADPAHSQSPTRSPLSSFSQPLSPGVTTPPTSMSGQASSKGVELSPTRSTTSPTQHGELAIETLGQALRKTASRDLSGFSRSPPRSAV